jgi:hypothetical protein
MTPYHDRMPALLRAEDFDAWLKGGLGADALKPAAESRSVGDHGCACESVGFELAEITRKRAVFCEDICKVFPANEQAVLVVRLSEEGQRGAKIAEARDYH